MAIKIEIFDKAKPDETPTLLLNTRVWPDGSFGVFACDKDGKCLLGGHFWSLTADARQCCPRGIRNDLGLDLDATGRIREA